MEGIHGVDVSWLHHSQSKDKSHGPQLLRSKSKEEISSAHVPHKASQSSQLSTNTLTKSISSPAHPSDVSSSYPDPAPQTPTKKPGLLRRSSREKVNGQGGSPIDASKPSPSRKSSWITSLSSKLSSVQSFPQPQATNVNANGQISHTPITNALQRSPSPASETRQSLQQSKSGSTGFFSNALRRLSSSSQLGANKLSPSGGMCPRKVMNIDPNRQRCLLPELKAAKLRRVAFCVDVEIAGGPRYKDDDDASNKKDKTADKKIKEKAEGDALKNPVVMTEEKEQADPNGLQPEAPTPAEQQPKKEMTRKKEKKKKSEEERRERKEQKRRKAEESGSIPMVITCNQGDDNVQATSGTTALSRPLDRPTVDPLRIYRRCCQLRETPVLKRITDQLASRADAAIKEPGVVTILDLSGSRLQLADVVTLSDWLAIVPVRKLILDDADLNDEGIRVMLAGLLAAVTPDFSRKRPTHRQKYEERSGVVEKLCLKNNPKITKEGWKHICLFIHMCKSLQSLDVSGNIFPTSPSQTEHYHHMQHVGKPPCDPAEVFAKAISERHGGSRFEELIMGECGLSTSQVRKIVDAVIICGIKRLGLASNKISLEGLQYIIHYLRSGICQGIDLGGNDIRDHLDILGEAFQANCPIWALSLADCKLDPASLKPLFPGLLNLHNLRFLDLSRNPMLFESRPSAVGLLQKYLPMITELRRIHLNHSNLAPNQAIAIADVLTECSQIAHLNILGNPKLSALASASTEESQEEAVALYASLMATARVSPTIVSIEIDVPTAENSEIVKALAKQVVAYCLRNMERWYTVNDDDSDVSGKSSPEINGDTGFTLGGFRFPEVREDAEVKEVEVPEVLIHLVGNADGRPMSPSEDHIAPDNDYIVGGTGVVKALNYCLAEIRRGSASMSQSGAVSPLNHPAIGVKAKAMSKNLLESARKIRTRLQPSLVRESKASDDMAFRRLLFLDNTLSGIIERFEQEYPETRVPGSTAHEDDDAATTVSRTSSTSSATAMASMGATPTTPGGQSLSSSAIISSEHSDNTAFLASDSDSETEGRPLRRASRHASDVSLAAKAQAAEEGKVLRINHELKRQKQEVKIEDDHERTNATGGVVPVQDEGAEDEHVRVLKEKLKALEVKEENATVGEEDALQLRLT